MAKFYDTSHWYEKSHFQTTGTRDKCVVSNPKDNCDYYFKTSIKKGAQDYKPEFWSEIIASEVGNLLGFKVLKYDIALHDGEIGCISKSMINNKKKRLIGGSSLLTGYDNTYQPNDKKSYSSYTFQFIQSALEKGNLGKYMADIIRTIIFDAIIGNSDRHQENWGFIAPDTNALSKSRYAPIYDNGCCLAREISDDAVKQMLKDTSMQDGFINRGCAEVRWEGTPKKLKHFELIRKIREEYPHVVETTIKAVLSKYNEQTIKNIVYQIDKNLKGAYKDTSGLSGERKELICILLKKRIEKLKQLRVRKESICVLLKKRIEKLKQLIWNSIS